MELTVVVYINKLIVSYPFFVEKSIQYSIYTFFFNSKYFCLCFRLLLLLVTRWRTTLRNIHIVTTTSSMILYHFKPYVPMILYYQGCVHYHALAVRSTHLSFRLSLMLTKQMSCQNDSAPLWSKFSISYKKFFSMVNWDWSLNIIKRRSIG